MSEVKIETAVGHLVPPYGVYQSPRIIVESCPFCGRRHEHGLAPDETDLAFRVAGCEGGDYLIEIKGKPRE